MIFDTHAHLDDKKFSEDLEEVIERAQAVGIKYITNIGFDLNSSRRSIELAEKYDFIYAAVGIHPHEAKAIEEEGWLELEELAKHPKVVAIGEMGLDYYYNLSPKDVQKEVFIRQIHLAKRLKKPIIIHDRDAHSDILEIVKVEKAGEFGGIMHCFSGSWPFAKECIRENIHISIAGPVTFNNATKVQEVAKQISLDWLLVETDCPYLTPVPHRGKRNEPANVLHVAEFIAKLRGISLEELAVKTTANAKKLFKI